MKSTKVVGISKQTDLFLIMPRHMSNAYAFARELLGIKGVKQILVGEGDFGVAVEGERGSGIESFLNKRKIGYKLLCCHYSFRGVANVKR